MKTVNDLNSRGIHVTQLLIGMVVTEVMRRMTGKKDGVLHEGLDQIIANQYTLLRYQDDKMDDESPEKIYDEVQRDHENEIMSGLNSEY